MRRTLKNLGARTLSILLVFSMFIQFLPLTGAAAAAPLSKAADAGDTDATGQPVLSVDFLGDYKPGDTFGGPQAIPPSGDWKYTSTSELGAIFWVGVGIDKLDAFALKDGIFSLEAGFYYNSRFIEPYTGTAPTATPDERDAGYLSVLKTYNEAPWGSDYNVLTAFTGLSPQMDGATQEAIDKPSNAEIMTGSDWKMTSIAIEKTAGVNDVGTNRFKGTTDKKTQYVAYIPFVLKAYDGNQALCLRLIRNATHFTLASGAGGYQSFGAWERNTARLPDNDLKLMLRFGGDLNIFTATKVPDPEYTATLKVSNAGVAQNDAILSISNDKSPNPPKVQGDGAVLSSLTEGTGMDLELTCRSGFEATVKVTQRTDGDVAVTTVTTDKRYFFSMPDGNVTVDVTFTPKTGEGVPYELTLSQKGTPVDVVGNKAWLASDKGQSDPATVGDQTLSATVGAPVTVHVNCRIDYLAKVTVKDINGGAVTINSASPGASPETDNNGIMTMTLPTGGTVTFTMPGADVRVDVEYQKSDAYKGNLALVYDSAVAAGDESGKDLVQLSYPVQAKDNTPGTGYSGVVGHDPAKVAEGVLGNPASGVTGNKDLFSSVQKGQTVTLTMARDPNHQIKSVVISRTVQTDPVNPTPDVILTPDAVANKNHLFTATFVQPDYEVNVTVTYEPRPLRTLELALTGVGGVAANTAKAVGTGKDDAQVSTNLEASPPIKVIEVFEKSEVTIVIRKSAGYSINSIQLVDGGGNNHFTSSMVTTAPDGAKTVKFKMPAVSLTAKIDYRSAPDSTYTATLAVDYAAGSTPSGGNTAVWSDGGTSVTSAAGANHSATVTVAPGYYIQSVTARAASAAAYPITVSGDGYNNGAGATVNLSMSMPAEDLAITVTMAKGVPPVELGYGATLRVQDNDNTAGAADNHAKLSFVDDLGGTLSGNVVRKDGTDTLAGIQAGNLVTLDLAAALDYYVVDVVVTPASLNVAVEWKSLTQAEFTMPAGAVSVVVEFRSKTVVPPTDTAPGLTVAWEQTVVTASDDNKVTDVDTTQLVRNQPITTNPQTIDHLTIPGDTVTLTLQVAPGYHVAHVVAVSNGVMLPVSLPDNGYRPSGAANEAVTADFVMPSGAVHVMVTYGEGVPGNKSFAGLTVQDDDNTTGADNWAMLSINGKDTPQVQKGETEILSGVNAGDLVGVSWRTDADYVLDVILVTPAGLGVVPTMTGPNSAEFIMPADNVMVLVRFRSAATAPLYTANLVIRGIPADKTLDDVGAATFSGTGTPPVYSITAAAGQTIGVDIFSKSGYYIEGFEVTPAALKVGTTLSGIFAAQVGSFVMPAANCTVNVTFGGGWPDSVAYNAVLWVTDPNAEPDNHASIKNQNVDRTQTSPDVMGGRSAVITGCESDVMEITFSAATGYQAEIILRDSAGKTVPYAWTEERTVSFRMPPNHVSAEVRYQKGAPALYDVEVFIEGTADDKVTLDATFDNASGGVLGPIQGDQKTGTLKNVRAGSSVIVDAATVQGRYIKAVLVMAGGELIALQAEAGTVSSLRGSFVMPKKPVKVYIYFDNGTPPTGDQAEYAAALTVTESGGSAVGDAGQAMIQTVTPPAATGLMNTQEIQAAVPLASRPIAVAKSNADPVYISVTKENRIQVAATPQGSYTVDDIRLTPIGSSLSFSVKFDWLDKNTVEFDMPSQPVAVEVLMSAAEPTYSAQVLVNNNAYTGAPGTSVNSAKISAGGSTAMQGQQLENLPLGMSVNVDLTIGAGYVAEVSVVTDSGSSTPLSVDADAVTQAVGFGMPASNVIVYVKFVRVADVNYSATLRIVSDKSATEANVALSAVMSDASIQTVNNSGERIENLLGKEQLNIAVTKDAAKPSHANTVVSGVLITTKAGTSYVPAVGEIYSCNMPKEDIVVTVVLAEQTAGLYIAAMSKTGDDGKAGNSLTSIKDLTTTGLPGEPSGWTAARFKDVVEVAFTTETGYYATVKAVEKTGGAELAVLQQGVTGSGRVRFAMPKDNVQVTVTYSTTPPGDAYPIEMVFSGHAKAAKNEIILRDTGTSDVLANLKGDSAPDEMDLIQTVSGVVIGTPLGLAATMDNDYRVKSAVLAVGTGDSYVSMEVALTAVDASSSTGGFLMPTAAATLTVTYKSGYSATLVMADASTAKGSTATLAEEPSVKAPITVDDTQKTATMDQLLTGAKIKTTFVAGAGAVLRGTLLTNSGGTDYLPETSAGSSEYLYAIESEDVTVTTVFDETAGASYLAAVKLKNDSGQAGNSATIVNTTAADAGTAALSGDIWTMARANDKLTLTVSLAEGYVAKLTARTLSSATDNVAVDPVAVGSDGSVSTLIMPRGENILVTVEFIKGDPTPRPYDPAHAVADPVKGYAPGWIQAVNNNDGESITVTVPTLGAETKAANGTVTLKELQSVYVAPDPGVTPAVEKFEVAYTFYMESATEPGAYIRLKAGVDYDLLDLTRPVYSYNSINYTSEQFTFQALTEDMMQLVSKGGMLYITTVSKDLTKPLPESYRTVLDVPELSLWAKPHDPERTGSVAGTIGSVNNTGIITVTIPTLEDVKGQIGNVPDEVTTDAVTGTKTEFRFRFYLNGTPGAEPTEETCRELVWGNADDTKNNIIISPVDPNQTNGSYTYDDYYTDGAVRYQGVKFYLKATDAASDIGKILANLGSEQNGHSLYVKAAADITESGSTDTLTRESGFVPLIVPQYYTLKGELTSYAPTHEAKLSLRRYTGTGQTTDPVNYEPDPTVTTTIASLPQIDWVEGRSTQQFRFQSSLLLEEGEQTATYLLVVEKAAHITYRRVDIVLDKDSATADLEFDFVDTIVLIGGDANQDTLCKDDDRDLIVNYMMHNYDWGKAPDDADPAAWAISVFNPATLAYTCDLDGDGAITGMDLDIQMAVENYNRGEADYGAPSGLSFTPPALTALETIKELPSVEESQPIPPANHETTVLPEHPGQTPEAPQEEKPREGDKIPPREDDPAALPEWAGPLPPLNNQKKEEDDENPSNNKKNDII